MNTYSNLDFSIDDYSLEDVISKSSKDLDNYIKKFHNQIVKLTEKTDRVKHFQNNIAENLTAMENRQKELENILNEFDTNSEDKENEFSSLDDEREKYYELSRILNQELNEMNETVSMIIKDVNRNLSSSFSNMSLEHQDESDDESDEPMNQVVKILNSHLSTVQWIDSTANQLSAIVQGTQSTKNK
nr:6787_t:CDS:2 [Entrophospora candida]